MEAFPIDIVIPWVDGSDPAWQQERASFQPSPGTDSSAARYRDWDTLRYWFRSVERYAPWVRTIHFITYGHLPAWLNTGHPKLHVVNHRDYIPEEYLPTFSSHTIELNMHRIEGLAEHFLYFNDDVFLNAPSKPEDFFIKGLPADTAVFGIIKNTDIENFMPYIMLNMMAVINMHFSKRAMLKKDFFKWFSPKNGRYVLNNLYLLPWSCYTGFRNFHTCVPYRKSTLKTVWETVPEILDRTCRHRFRCREDVNQYIFRYWQLATGTFMPHKPNSAYLTMGQQTAADAAKLLSAHKYQVVCVNDDPLEFDFEAERSALIHAFDAIFPDPSGYER